MSGPKNDETTGACGAGGFSVLQNGQMDCASSSLSGQARQKRFAWLQARFAMAGFELLRLEDGTLIVRRWRMLKALDSMAHAEQFLRQVSGSQA